MENSIKCPQVQSSITNRVIYITLVLASFAFMILKNWEIAIVMFGASGACDPFDQNVKWAFRPRWQKIWTVLHVVVLLALLFLAVISKA